MTKTTLNRKHVAADRLSLTDFFNRFDRYLDGKMKYEEVRSKSEVCGVGRSGGIWLIRSRNRSGQFIERDSTN